MSTATATRTDSSRSVWAVFGGLMLGMLVASLNMTLVAPAMPRIVADLGGIEHYSWIAISAMLASTVVVPIVGKLSDLYGRKAFFMGGIVTFTVGSALAGASPNFWFLIAARVVQGVGMGTMQPLSQAIVGDLVPARERGKYQGLLGASFGLSAMFGPALGGYITDHFSWRYLFFVNLPVALVALAVIAAYMHIPQQRRRSAIDVAGIATLSLGLTSGLMATVWGGSQYAWDSVQIVGLYAVSAALLIAFVLVESRVPDPVLPLRLWRSSIFTLSNLATAAMAVGMFGTIFFLPVYVQGVLADSATSSGTVLIPMLVSLVITSALNGFLISRTGRYKPQLLAGLVVMAVGMYLTTQLGLHSTNAEVVRDLILIGAGLGASMQTFVLVVQNSVSQADMGVATSATQLFRSIGASIGVAVMGSVLSSSLPDNIARHVPAATLARLRSSGQSLRGSAGSVLDPSALQHVPPALATAIRAGLADSLHLVFLAGLPFAVVALLAALLLREVPLRRTIHATDAGKELLAELGQATPEAEAEIGEPKPDQLARVRLLGLALGLLAGSAAQPGHKQLRSAVAGLAGGDLDQGRAWLSQLALAMVGETPTDGQPAAELTAFLKDALGEHSLNGQVVTSLPEFSQALAELSPDLRSKLAAISGRHAPDPARALTPDDLEALERVAVAVAAALLVDRFER